MKTCSFCLGEVPDAAVKCQHCGEWLEQPPLAYETQVAGGRGRRVPLAVIAAGLGVGSILVFLAVIVAFRATVTPASTRGVASPAINVSAAATPASPPPPPAPAGAR